jgi:hypothetical protein
VDGRLTREPVRRGNGGSGACSARLGTHLRWAEGGFPDERDKSIVRVRARIDQRMAVGAAEDVAVEARAEPFGPVAQPKNLHCDETAEPRDAARGRAPAAWSQRRRQARTPQACRIAGRRRSFQRRRGSQGKANAPADERDNLKSSTAVSSASYPAWRKTRLEGISARREPAG